MASYSPAGTAAATNRKRPSPSGSVSSERRQPAAGASGSRARTNPPTAAANTLLTLSLTQRVLWSYQNVTGPSLAASSGMLAP